MSRYDEVLQKALQQYDVTHMRQDVQGLDHGSRDRWRLNRTYYTNGGAVALRETQRWPAEILRGDLGRKLVARCRPQSARTSRSRRNDKAFGWLDGVYHRELVPQNVPISRFSVSRPQSGRAGLHIHPECVYISDQAAERVGQSAFLFAESASAQRHQTTMRIHEEALASADYDSAYASSPGGGGGAPMRPGPKPSAGGPFAGKKLKMDRTLSSARSKSSNQSAADNYNTLGPGSDGPSLGETHPLWA